MQLGHLAHLVGPSTSALLLVSPLPSPIPFYSLHQNHLFSWSCNDFHDHTRYKQEHPSIHDTDISFCMLPYFMVLYCSYTDYYSQSVSSWPMQLWVGTIQLWIWPLQLWSWPIKLWIQSNYNFQLWTQLSIFKIIGPNS